MALNGLVQCFISFELATDPCGKLRHGGEINCLSLFYSFLTFRSLLRVVDGTICICSQCSRYF